MVVSMTIRDRTGSNARAVVRALASAAVWSRSSAGPTRLIVRHTVVVEATEANKVLGPRSMARSDIAVAPSVMPSTNRARVFPG